MVLDPAANFVRGATDAAIDDTQTTVSVVDASIFPDPSTDGEYNVVIWDADTYPRPDQDPAVEVLRVTAVDTTNDDLTVTRAQETTSGASHPSGSALHVAPTAKMFGDIDTALEVVADYSQDPPVVTADVDNQSVSTDEALIGVEDPDNPGFPKLTNARKSAPRSLTVQPTESSSGVGSFEVGPPLNGGNRSHFLTFNNPDLDNAGGVKWEIEGQVADIESFRKGTGNAPTKLKIRDFADGVSLQRQENQGSPSSPSELARFEGSTEFETTGIYSSTTTVTGDNTAQTIFEPPDPPLIGSMEVFGMEDGVANNTPFVDDVKSLRNDTLIDTQNDAPGSPPRTYSLSGTDIQISIDDSGVTYRLNVVYTGSHS